MKAKLDLLQHPLKWCPGWKGMKLVWEVRSTWELFIQIWPLSDGSKVLSSVLCFICVQISSACEIRSLQWLL